jgi:NAD(P)-dependent dehydrogenase (short-subunit alcohol dehydrogenase family)
LIGQGGRAVDANTQHLKNFSLDGQVAVVTGGAGGIGRAVARLFAAAGARVVVADRDEAAARGCADEIVRAGGRSTAAALDVADEDSIEHAFSAVVAREGRVDVLVCNAGINIRAPATEIPLADWNRVMSVNLTGVFLCARAAARRMIDLGNGGAIVSTASIMSFSGGGLYPNIAYQTAKGALVNLTRGLAVEWAEAGIRVNAVAPTWVRTPLIDALLGQPALMDRIAAMTPLGRIAEPEEIAPAMLFLASSAAAMITGHTLPVDGGFLAQ